MTTSWVCGSVAHLKVGSSSARLGEGGADFLFVAAGFGRDGQAVHRRGIHHRPQVNAVQIVVVVEHVAEVDGVDLGDGADFAGDELLGFAVVLALDVEDVAELDGLFVVADVDLGVGRAFALVDAEDGQLADERVGGDLEDMGQQRLVGIFGVFKGAFARRGVAGEEWAGIAFRGLGKCRSIASRSSGTPTPVLALVKRIGMTCPWSMAFSKGA